MIPLDETKVALQQIDLPKQMFDVIEHHVQLYVDTNDKIVKAKLPKFFAKNPQSGFILAADDGLDGVSQSARPHELLDVAGVFQ